MENIFYSTTERHKPKIINEGFEYIQDRKLVIETYWSWRCILKNSKKCLCRIHANFNGHVLKIIGEHNHSSQIEKVLANERYIQMKQDIKLTEINPVNIIAKHVQDIGPSIAASLPKIESMKRRLRSIRKIHLNEPNNPKSLFELVIPRNLTLTSNGNIMFFDSSVLDKNNRIIIFARPDQICNMRKAEHIFMDGTFRSAPIIAYQLFTIHILICQRAFPIMYSLLPDKKASTYKKLFLIIKSIIPEFLPKTIMTDFEGAIINSCIEMFPKSQCKGCLFHLAQSVQRKTNEKYKKNYDTDPEFKIQIKMLSALAFLPPNQVCAAFSQLVNNIPIEIGEYFRTTYIGTINPFQQTIPAIFPINFWNINDRIEYSLPRTNNFVEGWHNRFNLSVGNPHPTIYKLIRKIKKEMDLVSLQIIQEQKGIENFKQKKYNSVDKNILNLYNRMKKSNIGAYNIMEILRSFAYNLH